MQFVVVCPSPLWSILENLQKVQWRWEGEKKKARDEKGIQSPRFLPIFQDRGTKRARSQRQVPGDPEIRNGCKRAPRLKEEECLFLRVASSGRDPERTRFPRSTLAKVDHRGKNSLNTPLMSRLRSPVVSLRLRNFSFVDFASCTLDRVEARF